MQYHIFALMTKTQTSGATHLKTFSVMFFCVVYSVCPLAAAAAEHSDSAIPALSEYTGVMRMRETLSSHENAPATPHIKTRQIATAAYTNSGPLHHFQQFFEREDTFEFQLQTAPKPMDILNFWARKSICCHTEAPKLFAVITHTQEQSTQTIEFYSQRTRTDFSIFTRTKPAQKSEKTFTIDDNCLSQENLLLTEYFDANYEQTWISTQSWVKVSYTFSNLDYFSITIHLLKNYTITLHTYNNQKMFHLPHADLPALKRITQDFEYDMTDPHEHLNIGAFNNLFEYAKTTWSQGSDKNTDIQVSAHKVVHWLCGINPATRIQLASCRYVYHDQTLRIFIFAEKTACTHLDRYTIFVDSALGKKPIATFEAPVGTPIITRARAEADVAYNNSTPPPIQRLTCTIAQDGSKANSLRITTTGGRLFFKQYAQDDTLALFYDAQKQCFSHEQNS